MNASLHSDDLHTIEHEVYPNIVKRLLQGFTANIDKKSRKKLEVGGFEETVHTIGNEHLEILLHGADDVCLEDICNIAAQHPQYLSSYMSEGVIHMQFLWVKPDDSNKKKRIAVTANTGSLSSSSFWTVRRLLVLICMAMFIALFKGKLVALMGFQPQ